MQTHLCVLELLQPLLIFLAHLGILPGIVPAVYFASEVQYLMPAANPVTVHGGCDLQVQCPSFVLTAWYLP